MADSKTKARKYAGRVAFLANLDGIKKMIEEGHSVVVVFESYQDKVGIKSGQFGKYVRKFIGSKRNGNTDRAAEKGKDTKEKRPIRAREPGQPAFVSSDTPRDRDSLLKGKG